MKEFNSKKRIVIKNVVLIAMIISFASNLFASNYEPPKTIVGPNSSEKDNVVIDDINYGLEKIMSVMTPEENLLAMLFVSNYRQGDILAEEQLDTLIKKYNSIYDKKILNYILMDSGVKHLGTYDVDYQSNSVSFVPIMGLTNQEDTAITYMANYAWSGIARLAPTKFLSHIASINLEVNKGPDNMVTLHPLDPENLLWEISVDIRLLETGNEQEWVKNIIYATVYYFVLNNEQVEQLVIRKDNYTFDGNYFNSDSYINLFYKRFWKGRRKEINASQYDLYKKEFLNSKASRTVYDDMAVSFYNYVENGRMTRYLGFRADKTNFFDDFAFFKQLAKEYRAKLNIKLKN